MSKTYEQQTEEPISAIDANSCFTATTSLFFCVFDAFCFISGIFSIVSFGHFALPKKL